MFSELHASAPVDVNKCKMAFLIVGLPFRKRGIRVSITAVGK